MTYRKITNTKRTSSAILLSSVLIFAILALAESNSATSMILPAAYATTALKYPSLHLINSEGKFVNMQLMGYQQSDGKLKQFLPDTWYLKSIAPSTFTIKMEDVFKLRADQGKGFKVVDQARIGDNVIKGMNVVIRYGSNDDWDHFITYTETSNFPDSAYKNTYVLNQHNPCFSDESFQFPAGSVHVVQVYATVYFKDSNTWAEYVTNVNVIGANADDNPMTGCTAPSASYVGGSIFAQQQQQSVIIINNDNNHASHSNGNSHHDNNHHSSDNHNEHHDNHDHEADSHPTHLRGNKNLHEDQTEYDPTDTNSGTGPHVEHKDNNDNSEHYSSSSSDPHEDSSNDSHDEHHSHDSGGSGSGSESSTN